MKSQSSPVFATLAMAVLAVLAVLAGLSVSPPAQSAAPGCADVEVINVRPNQGHLMVAAYLSADTFTKRPVVSVRLAAAEATMRFELCGLSGDTVALTLFQDLDSDGKMGSNLLGMPTEPWGASGSPGMTGPSWATSSVALNGSPIVVKMSQ